MKKYPIHVTWAQGKTPITLCITWGLRKRNYDKQFKTVTTHKNNQNYYNEQCAKYYDLKKYRGVIFHDTEGWCKMWRKTDLWFWKWKEYGKFSLEQLKVSTLGFWWDPLIQSSKSMSLKSTEELCVIIMKNDAKFEEELTCHFKIGIRHLTNFDLSARKS